MQRTGEPDSEFEFLSSVTAECLGDLEALLFFHPRQLLFKESIQACVTEFGTPEILQRASRLCVGIPRNGAQGLFACHRGQRANVPIGVIVYLRTSRELLRILHLAVHPAYEHDGQHTALGLGLLLIEEVRHSARCIAGVRSIQLPYVQNSFLPVPRLSAAVEPDIATLCLESLSHDRPFALS